MSLGSKKEGELRARKDSLSLHQLLLEDGPGRGKGGSASSHCGSREGGGWVEVREGRCLVVGEREPGVVEGDAREERRGRWWLMGNQWSLLNISFVSKKSRGEGVGESLDPLSVSREAGSLVGEISRTSVLGRQLFGSIFAHRLDKLLFSSKKKR